MFVAISNGFKNFHLASSAAEANSRGFLSKFFTGLYPTKRVRELSEIYGFSKWRRLSRLDQRRADIDELKVVSLVKAELAFEAALRLQDTQIGQPFGEKIELYAMRAFAHSVARHIPTLPRGIYHYRSGYGLSSLPVAKDSGHILLCDHSIVHPFLLSAILDAGGNTEAAPDINLSSFWPLVESDISHSDHVLVNSDFVKSTFLRCGVPTTRVSVIYLGIDDSFLRFLPSVPAKRFGPARLLFAGHFGKRKGADALAQCLHLLPTSGWTLDLAGPCDPHYRPLLHAMLRDSRVRYLGSLDRRSLAEVMQRSDIFVFPSLVEGSARVVFEAMASGCYPITTENSGTIVGHHAHGDIIKPNDASAIAMALNNAIEKIRESREAGAENSNLVRHSYNQRTYGDHLQQLYLGMSPL